MFYCLRIICHNSYGIGNLWIRFYSFFSFWHVSYFLGSIFEKITQNLMYCENSASYFRWFAEDAAYTIRKQKLRFLTDAHVSRRYTSKHGRIDMLRCIQHLYGILQLKFLETVLEVESGIIIKSYIACTEEEKRGLSESLSVRKDRISKLN